MKAKQSENINNNNKEEQPIILSSLQLTSKTTLDKQQYRKAKTIIKSLCQHHQAYDFKAPVDWKGLNLTDYPMIVKHPMDLGTAQKLLNASKFQTVQQFLDNIQLIWDNCKIYNQAGSWIYESAQKIQRIFKKMIKNYFPDIPIIIPQKLNQIQRNQKNSMYNDNISDEEITYYQKLNFSERVERLDENQLQKLIEYLYKTYPETLKQVPLPSVTNQFGEIIQNPDRIQILVDNFNLITFRQVNEFINQFTEEKPFGAKKIKIV